MTPEEFKTFWELRYPNTVPIGHYFKHDYPDRWFRIHSLPDSRRYPSKQEDWEILLARQNTILADLFGNESSILLVTGHYYAEAYAELQPIDEIDAIKHLPFQRLQSIDLHLLNPEYYDKGQIYMPMFTEQIWQIHQFDETLKAIALGDLEAFFISIVNNCMIAPYDGGMDIILKDSSTRDFYKEKYAAWLSLRQDGL
jgi:hypothetical protein